MVNERFVCYEMLDEDIFSAQKAYSCWEESRYETPIDFVSKKRSVDLAYLLNEVIENELTKIEQSIVHLHYFENLSITDIASELSLHRSTVARRLECINEKIFCNLKYAVKYKYDVIDNCIIPLAIREAFSICAIQKAMPSSVAGRIIRLRNLAKVNRTTLASCTNIDERRLYEVESGHSEITAKEAVCLSAFFRVSTDYLLTGNQTKLMEEIT